jgi:methylenetetrahydrofolate--tRNA-(uracil-5-)-methyltransferase
MVHIIGGGLAGSEAAWQAASRGVRVVLHEMRPVRPTAVHKTDGLAELVCSNSFRGDKLDNAVGLLKEEMRRLGSLVMRAADAHRVPAGAALAVDRERFSQAITEAIAGHPLIRVAREEIPRIPDDPEMFPLIIATGPLTSDSLSSDIASLVGGDHLYFYDAISPIVLSETIDRTKVFRASRWGRSLRNDDRGVDARGADLVRSAQAGPTGPAPRTANAACGVDDGEGDYLNCPMTEEEYNRFYDAVVSAESATVHDFDKEKFFEGCLPIEVMAHRGRDTLRFGPMKPVGLVDPRTGRTPFAVVQLRQDNLAGDHFSLVGFQTQLKWGEQARVLAMIPGLEHAEFVRFGMVHRNTYINGPTVLRETWQTRARGDLFFAGQISGVEGYVESAASGLIAGRNAAALALGEEPSAPPRTTAIGALGYYVSHADPRNYQPTNITFGIMPAPDAVGDRGSGIGDRNVASAFPVRRSAEREGGRRKNNKKADRKAATSERALAALEDWLGERAAPILP